MISIWEVNLSVAVAVGFIALFGLAVETGIVMVIYLNDAMQQLVSIKGNSREAYQQRRSERICNQWSGKTSAPKNNDGMRYTFRPGSHIMEHRCGKRYDEAHCASYDRQVFTSAIHILLVTPIIFLMQKEYELKKFGKIDVLDAAH